MLYFISFSSYFNNFYIDNHFEKIIIKFSQKKVKTLSNTKFDQYL